MSSLQRKSSYPPMNQLPLLPRTQMALLPTNNGTTNCFVLTHSGIIIGVDSRSTSRRAAGRRTLTPDGVILIWTGDENKKFLVIVDPGQFTPCVCMTLTGSTSRLKEIRRFLRGHVPNDIITLKDMIDGYLRKNLPSPTENICQIYLAGFERLTQTYRVYLIGDNLTMVEYVSSMNHTFFGAIGSGSESAMTVLRQLGHLNPLIHGKEVVTWALMKATNDDVCTGGMLRVYWIQGSGRVMYPSPICLIDNHCIDLLHRNLVVNDKSLFFFSKAGYTSMNYNVLDECLVINGYVPPRISDENYPTCMGMVDKAYSMFIVEFKWNNAADALFDCGQWLGDHRVRRLKLRDLEGHLHTFIVAKPDALLLYQMHHKEFLKSI